MSNNNFNQEISRRSFFKAGLGTCLALELASAGDSQNSFINPFASPKAFADSSKVTSKIIVVSKTAIGIVVFDVGQKPRVGLEGAEVTIKSLFNGKEVSGTSDGDGKVVLEISELAETNTEASKDSETLQFNGCISITRAGYRDVFIPKTRIISHVGLALPTRSLDSTTPYMKELSFDGWDIQYFKSTFMCANSNAAQHDLKCDIFYPEKGNAKISLIAHRDGRDREVCSKSINVSHKGFLNVCFHEMFLQPRSNKCLSPDDKIKVRLDFAGKSYYLEPALEIKSPPMEDVDSGNIVIDPTANYQGDESLTIATMPSSLPKPLGGSSFSVWKPSFPVLFDFSPFGYLMAGFQFGSLKAVNDKGFFDKDGWKSVPRESAKKQYETQSEQQNAQLDAYKASKCDPNDPEKTKSFSHDLSKEFTLSGAAQVYANLNYDWDESYWTGALNGLLAASLDATWTLQMSIGPVPVFITFSMTGEGKGSLRFATKTSGSSIAKLFENAVYDVDGSGASINLSFEIALAAGVGISGFASVYVRGSGQLTMACMFYDTSEVKNKPWPRLLLGAGVNVSLGVQLLLFKWSGTMWDKDFPRIYDSHSSKTSKAVAQDLDESFRIKNLNSSFSFDSNNLPSIKELCGEAQIVTNDELIGCSELVATKANIVLLNSEKINDELYAVKKSSNDNFIIKMPELELYQNAKFQNYKLVKSPLKVQNNSSLLQVEGIAKGYRGGIKPKSDVEIAKSVFSDGRQKVITFGNRTYLFRIASVNYAGKAKSRLIYQLLNDDETWGNPVVVDFATTGISETRDELYDYDFDITEIGEFAHYLYVFIISGKRSSGDKTAFATVASDTFATLVRLYDSNSDKAPLDVQTAVSWKALGETSSTKRVYSLMCPRLVSYTDNKSTMSETNSCVVGTYLVHYADSNKPEDLLTDSARSGVVAFYCDHNRDESPTITLAKATLSRGATCIVPGQITLDDNPAAYEKSKLKHFSFGYMHKGGGGFKGVSIDSTKEKIEIAISNRNAFDDLVTRIYHINDDDKFLTIRKASASSETVEGTLQLATFDSKSMGDVKFESIGPKSPCPVDVCVSDNGNWLFYSENTKGKTGQVFKDNGENISDIKNEIYRVVAIPYVGGKYMESFTLCELDHPIDSIASMTSNNLVATLIASQVTNLDKSQANFYDIRIPFVACLTPVSCSTVDAFAYCGEKCEFSVAVRNDGNTLIDEATFSLYLDDPTNGDKFVDSCTVNLAKVKTSTPGSTLTYSPSFKIPANWSGTKNVYVMLSNLSVVNPVAKEVSSHSILSATNNKVLTYHIDADDCPLATIAVDSIDNINDSDLSSANMSSATVSQDITGLVKTGDDFGGLGTLALASSAFAGAMMAYSARRVKLQEDGDEDVDNNE